MIHSRLAQFVLAGAMLAALGAMLGVLFHPEAETDVMSGKEAEARASVALAVASAPEVLPAPGSAVAGRPRSPLPDDGDDKGGPQGAQTDPVQAFHEAYALETVDRAWADQARELLVGDFGREGVAAGIFEGMPHVDCRESRCLVTGQLHDGVEQEALLHVPYATNCARMVARDADKPGAVSLMLICGGWRERGSVALRLQ